MAVYDYGRYAGAYPSQPPTNFRMCPDNSQASVMDRDRDIENLSGEHRDAARRVLNGALT